MMNAKVKTGVLKFIASDLSFIVSFVVFYGFET
jgi:hypothetical protein